MARKQPPAAPAGRKGRGLGAAIVSVAERQPVDVTRALRRARTLPDDEALAVELVRMAYDVDGTTVMPFLDALGRIQDETWRARTLFSVFDHTNRRLTGELPGPAQDRVVALVQGTANERMRAITLRKLSADLPAPLRSRLVAVAEGLADPLARIETLVEYEKQPSHERATAFLETARAIADEEARGEALAIVASVLPQARLEEAFADAAAIANAGVAARAQARIAARFSDEHQRRRAQLEILARAADIADPLRKAMVLSALGDLPPEQHQATAEALFDLARQFEDPDLRCRALFDAGDFATDERQKRTAFLAGVAAAERVPDLERRSELLGLLYPVAPFLDAEVQAEVRRAVERLEDPEVRQRLRSHLGRLFVYNREPVGEPALPPPEPAPASRARPASDYVWDLFISYATDDIRDARSLAFDLKSRGLHVFLAADEIDAQVGSAGWLAALDRAIQGTRAMLVLVTPGALASPWVEQEWTKYYIRMVQTSSGRLMSLRLRGPAIADLPLTLQTYQVVDSETGRIEPGHLTRILDLVGRTPLNARGAGP
jgi:hypothetical protein